MNCLGCLTILKEIDKDPNGDLNCVCARCRAEEEHDFDAYPNVRFDRCGNYIEKPKMESNPKISPVEMNNVNPAYQRILNIWYALESNPNLIQDVSNDAEIIVRGRMEQFLGEPVKLIPYKLFPLDACTPNSNRAIIEIKEASYTMAQLDECGPRDGAFIPQRKITYLQLACGLTDGPKGRRENNHFQTGYFCYLLQDGIYYMTIQQILKKILPEEGTALQCQTWRMNAKDYGVFFTSEHWTKLK